MQQNSFEIAISFCMLAGFLLFTAGCGGGSSSGPAADDTTKATGVKNPTYHENIAQILNDNCVVCHRDDGIAPFKLDNYDASKTYDIHFTTEDRTMPPYLADNSGQCNTFKDARWLSNDDIATIGNWVNDGKPEGPLPASPLPPPPQIALDLSEVSATAAMTTEYTPTGSTDHPYDDYRCFIIDPAIAADKYLTAYEVRPGNNAMVHHIILYGLKSDMAEVTATTLDSADNTPGYTCFGGSGIQGEGPNHVGFLAGWAPGTNVTRFPTGTGIKILANHKMVMQVHYNLANGTGTDKTAVDLALSETVAKDATVLLMADTNMVLPPGVANATTSISTAALPVNLKIHGVFPHMHTLGRQIHVEKINSAGNSTCVVDVPRWSFEWQQFFFYSQANGPVAVNGGDKLRLTCTYDTSSRTSDVTWGDGTQDEMCVNFFYTTMAP